MARTGQTSALASARKKSGKRVLPHPPSNRKLTMKHIELTPAQDRILKDMLQFTNESIEEWMKDAVFGRLHADIDQYYTYDDPRRDAALKAVETWKIYR